MNTHAAKSADEQRPAPPRRVHLIFATLFFAAIAIYGSLVPLDFQPLSLDEALQKFRHIEQRELVIQSRTDLVANVLLFIPIGFCCLGMVGIDRPLRAAFVFVLPLAVLLAGFSVAIEFSQLWFPRRTVSTSDILAQIIGAAIGASIWLAVGQALVDWVRSFFLTDSTQSRWHKLLQLYVLSLCIYSVMPLDLTISVGELYEKYQNGKIVLVPFTFGYASVWDLAYNLIIDAIVFVPVGMLAMLSFFRERSVPRGIGQSIAWGALVVVGIELAQLIVFSRVSDTTDLITCTAGVAIGAWLARRWSVSQTHDGALAARSQRNEGGLLLPGFWKWVGITVVYMIVLLGIFWAPFEFRVDSEFARPRVERFFEVPFKWLYRGSEFKAIKEVLRKTLFFGVLGALCVGVVNQLSVPKTIRRLLLVLAVLSCAGWALGIELGQIVQPAHTPDFTDVLLCTMGAAVGLLIATRFRPSDTG